MRDACIDICYAAYPLATIIIPLTTLLKLLWQNWPKYGVQEALLNYIYSLLCGLTRKFTHQNVGINVQIFTIARSPFKRIIIRYEPHIQQVLTLNLP